MENRFIKYASTLSAAGFAGLMWWLDKQNLPQWIEDTALILSVVLVIASLVYWFFAFLDWPRSKSPKKTGARRDVWLMDAIRFIVTGNWSGPEFPDTEQMDSMKEAVDFIQQKALDGELPVWGIPLGDDLQNKIDAADWKTLRIDWWTAIAGETENLELKEGSAISNNFPTYMAPMTTKAIVEELWENNK